MAENERSIDKLARYVIYIIWAAIALALCTVLKNIIIYIIAAGVVSLAGRPVMRMFHKIRIGKWRLPSAPAAIITLIIMLFALVLVCSLVVPVMAGIFRDVARSLQTGETGMAALSLKDTAEWINHTIIHNFPEVGPDFSIYKVILGAAGKIVNIGAITSISGFIATLASKTASAAVAIFSVIFISFFFLRDSKLFTKIICSTVADRLESKVENAIGDIEQLLSRYFCGLIVEVIGVAMLNFLGLWSITGIGPRAALGIGAIAGILNIIPYVGPLIGELFGATAAIVLKLSGSGIDMNIWLFALLVLGIMFAVQLMDNFLFQPLIYSSSIKASPLEIFIVLLAAGHTAGITGMLVAIPAYTVFRVIAGTFFHDVKMVRRLLGN